MIEATLVKRKTDDGLIEIRDHINLGAKYLIDPSSEQEIVGFNTEKEVRWSRKMVKVDNGSWFPSELLDWPGKTV